MDPDKEQESVRMAEAAPSTAAVQSTPLGSLLRGRLTQALSELAECRRLLAEHQIPHESSFSSKVEDHADVLAAAVDDSEGSTDAANATPTREELLAENASLPQRLRTSLAPADLRDAVATPSLDEAVAAEQQEAASPSPTTGATATAAAVGDQARELEEVRGLLRQREAELTALRRQALALKEQQQQRGGAQATEASSVRSEEALPCPGEAAASSAHTRVRSEESLPCPGGGEHEREKERLEVELSMAKALLMLNNVNMSIDLDEDRGASSSAAEVVSLKGSRQLINLLLTLKQKVSLLHQQYLLLRGDLLYMNHEMSVCRHWILQSFRMAMQQQSQEHSSLQSRFERLSKVLN